MSYLARDGYYLKLLPGGNLVSFSAPGGSPERLPVQFELEGVICKGLSKGVAYMLVVPINGTKYYVNATNRFYLTLNSDPGLLFTPIESVNDTYTFQKFPGQLDSVYGSKQYQFMLEPAGAPPNTNVLGCTVS